MAPSFYELLKSFDKDLKFDGSNWHVYRMEMQMTFGADKELWGILKGTSTCPSPNPESSTTTARIAAWQEKDTEAKRAIYKTISSAIIRSAHVKADSTSAECWASLTKEYQKDSRSTRFELKRRLFNPVHDTTQPISTYLESIVNASEHLAAIGHKPSSTEVVDSIIMHLDPSWNLIKTILVSQSDDPTLDQLKSTLLEHEGQMQIRRAEEDNRSDGGVALYSSRRKGSGRDHGSKHGKGKPTRREADSDGSLSGSGKDSDSSQKKKFSWLKPKSDKDCHRCGLPGHIARVCMYDMPRYVKDKIRSDRAFYSATGHSSDFDSALHSHTVFSHGHSGVYPVPDSDPGSDSDNSYDSMLDYPDAKAYKAHVKEKTEHRALAARIFA